METEYFEFEVSAPEALFSDTVQNVGGEKCSTQFPSYDAIRGLLESIYWKPTFVWVVDAVRVMNPVNMAPKSTRKLMYTDNKADISVFTYLTNVRYQVRAHIEWNLNRPDLIKDRCLGKHIGLAQRWLERGGKHDTYLGTRECQALVVPKRFGEGEGYYDSAYIRCNAPTYHSITYPDHSSDKAMYINYWNLVMNKGVISYPLPSDCPIRRKISNTYTKIVCDREKTRISKAKGEHLGTVE